MRLPSRAIADARTFVLGKERRPSALGNGLSVTGVCHREVAARQSAGSLEAEGAEGRRFRLETKPITSPRCVRSVGRFAAPHQVGFRVGAGASGKAGRTRQSQDLAGKRGPEIVRQVSSLLVGGERHSPTSKKARRSPSNLWGDEDAARFELQLVSISTPSWATTG